MTVPIHRKGDRLVFKFGIRCGEFVELTESKSLYSDEKRREHGERQHLPLGDRRCQLESLQQLETVPVYLMHHSAKMRTFVRKIVRSIRIARGSVPLYRDGKLVRCQRVNGKTLPVEIAGVPEQFLDACERHWITWEIAHGIPVVNVIY